LTLVFSDSFDFAINISSPVYGARTQYALSNLEKIYHILQKMTTAL